MLRRTLWVVGHQDVLQVKEAYIPQAMSHACCCARLSRLTARRATHV